MGLVTKFTAAEDDLLRQLWAEGLSASKIADRLGAHRTRHSVISRRNYLGLPMRVSPFMKMRKSRVEAKSRSYPHSSQQSPGNVGVVVDAPCVNAILGLMKNECRWPVGDPYREGFHFCCQPTAGTYCAEHSAIAFTRVHA